MTGRVCTKHEEWCPEGVCRWCEPETTAGGWLANWKPASGPVMPSFRYLGTLRVRGKLIPRKP